MKWTAVTGNLELLKFYLKSVSTLHRLPKWLRNPDTLIETISASFDPKCPKKFELSVPSDISAKYNEDFDKMKADLRSLHTGEREGLSYKMTLALLMILRLLCLVTAYNGQLVATLVISSLQFLVAPYSLFVSLALALALCPPIYCCHYLVYSLLGAASTAVTGLCPQYVTDLVTSLDPYLHISITPMFILAFFTFDQLACLYCHLMTPCKQFTVRETLTHVVWGFLNTKTYTLVLLLHLMSSGLRVPLLLWILDWQLGLTQRVSDHLSSHTMHWLELFYTQHRIAHLPRVYEHAHKLHHYLHGTLAFDAHIYGNGMPEEFFFLVLELSMGVCLGVTPASLNRLILQYSLDNKFGHTQWLKDDQGQNFHANHHLIHVKNYGIYNSLLDMYFNTATDNDKYRIKPSLYCEGAGNLVFEVEKKLETDQIVFEFTPVELKE